LAGVGAELLAEVVVVAVLLEGEGEPEVDVGDVEEAAELVLEVTVGVVAVVVAAVVVVDVVDEGAHDSLSEMIVPWIGRFIAEIGVPGGTSTLNV